MKFLLTMLRQIKSLEKVHLVWFPSSNEMQLFAAGKSVNHELFAELKQTGIVDSYVNLNAALITAKIDIQELRSPADHHFSRKGNEWIAAKILEQIHF